jgi:hypothetical protein
VQWLASLSRRVSESAGPIMKSIGRIAVASIDDILASENRHSLAP